MGWYSTPGVTTKLQAVKNLVYENNLEPDYHAEIMGHSGKYFALKVKEIVNGAWQEGISAMVVESNKRDGDFWYTFIPESMGPNADTCPKKILDLLTPAENEYANRWRERCRQNLDNKISIKEGDIVTFKDPITFHYFGEFVSGKVFRKVSATKQTFKCMDNERIQFIPVTITKQYLKRDMIESIKIR